jgi:hypothetical protein
MSKPSYGTFDWKFATRVFETSNDIHWLDTFNGTRHVTQKRNTTKEETPEHSYFVHSKRRF